MKVKAQTGIGGKNTAKRKIQVRQYVEEMSKSMRSHSDPFAQDDADEPDVLKPGTLKFSFKTDYIASSDSDLEENEEKDDILAKKLDLDEADRFMAALRMPKLRKSRESSNSVKPVVLPMDLSALKAESERIERLIMAEAVEHEEEEEKSD